LSKILKEGLENNDLRNLVSNLVSIDQYKSKIGDDKNMVVLAVKIQKKDPAIDLSSFIEHGSDDLMDVDVSPGPDQNGNYTVYIEIERNSRLFDTIDRILSDVKKVDENIEKWSFVCYDNKQPQEWSKQAFAASVCDSSYDYVIKHDPEAKAIESRIKFLNKY
jgi:hypothetical protein